MAVQSTFLLAEHDHGEYSTNQTSALKVVKYNFFVYCFLLFEFILFIV